MQESCWQYWPDTVGEVTEFGEYIVDLISEEILTGFTIRTLSVLNKKVSKLVLQDGTFFSCLQHIRNRLRRHTR